MSKALTKEELRTPDSFISFFQKTIKWCRENTRTLVIILIGLIVLLASGALYLQNQKAMNAKAADAYTMIVQNQPADDAEATKEAWSAHAQELQGFIDTYPKASMTPMVYLDLGKAQTMAMQYDKALGSFEQARASLPKPYKLMASEAMAVVFQFQNKFEQSSEIWSTLAQEEENPFVDYHLYNLGLTQAELGQKDQAQDTYQKIIDEHASSAYLGQAQRQLALLKD